MDMAAQEHQVGAENCPVRKQVMSLPDETLRKILLQIQQNAVVSQRNMGITSQQISAKERERRIVQITQNEIGSMQGDLHLYKPVGKMYRSKPVDRQKISLLVLFRFLQVPRKDMEGNLKSQERELTDDISGLSKKVRTDI